MMLKSCPACNGYSGLILANKSGQIAWHCENLTCQSIFPPSQSELEEYNTSKHQQRTVMPKSSEPKTEVLSPGVEQIPFEAMEALGEIFNEGETKYGLDNWKAGIGSKKYQRERLRHAIRHLMLYANGDRSEPHLAKVMWFAATQIWTEKNEQPNKD